MPRSSGRPTCPVRHQNLYGTTRFLTNLVSGATALPIIPSNPHESAARTNTLLVSSTSTGGTTTDDNREHIIRSTPHAVVAAEHPDVFIILMGNTTVVTQRKFLAPYINNVYSDGSHAEQHF